MSSARMTPDGLPAGFLAQSESYSTITLKVSDRIAVLTLNRPDKLNAFDETMIREIRQVIWRANFDPGIGVLVITGAVEAWLQLGSVSALWNSEYGTALVRKLVFVMLVAALGAYHWRFAQPALTTDRSLTALRWSIALDVVFLLGVLVLTAILTGTAPPAGAA